MEYRTGSNASENPSTIPWDRYLNFPDNEPEADGHICNGQIPWFLNAQELNATPDLMVNTLRDLPFYIYDSPQQPNNQLYLPHGKYLAEERKGALGWLSEASAFRTLYRNETPDPCVRAATNYGVAVLPRTFPGDEVNATGIFNVHNSKVVGQDPREPQRDEFLSAGYIPPTPNLSASSTPSTTSPVCATPDLATDAQISTPIAVSPGSQIRISPTKINAVASSSAIPLEPSTTNTKKRKAEESEPTQALKITKIDNVNSMKYTCDLPQCNGYKTDRQGDWKRHEQSAQHGGTGIKCDKCGKHYARIDSLRRHQQKKH